MVGQQAAGSPFNRLKTVDLGISVVGSGELELSLAAYGPDHTRPAVAAAATLPRREMVILLKRLLEEAEALPSGPIDYESNSECHVR